MNAQTFYHTITEIEAMQTQQRRTKRKRERFVAKTVSILYDLLMAKKLPAGTIFGSAY
jgi:hypothetical protein